MDVQTATQTATRALRSRVMTETVPYQRGRTALLEEANAMVCVRLFAALREAAGTGEVEVSPGTLEQILADLARRFGPAFTRLLSSASVLVDGKRLSQPSATVADKAEVALLPPFSGG